MLRLETLGGLALAGSGPGVATQRRRLALLALLAAADRGLTRDRLVAYLWPESPTDNARHALEQLVYALRRQLGDAVLLGPDPLRLNPELITSDVAEFEQALARGAPADAVTLYRGPFLDGFYLNGADDFERWVEEERSRLAGQYASGLQTLADSARDGKDYTTEIAWRRKVVATDPLNGGAALALMRALASAGDGAGALQYARVYESLMRVELDSAPDPPITAFVQELRSASAAAPAPDRPTSVSVGDATEPVSVHRAAPAEQHSAFPLPSRRIVAALAALVTAITFAVVAFRSQRHRPGEGATDPRLVAVLPFRVAGADPALSYLREGMVDLLAVKLTGEGGPRALDPRAVLAGWHRAAPSPAEDLAPGAAVDVARGLGAGRLIDGGVVGTPSHLVLTASIVAVPSGAMRARGSVAGTADSLPALVDRLTAQLLAGEAGRTDLATLTSLAALRAYLDGRSALRAGRFQSAFRSFDQALELDSTFALAGIGLNEAKFWDGGDDSGRGLRLVWAARNRLSPRDRTLIAGWLGPPNSPILGTVEEHQAANERAVAAVPERPESWYELGDGFYHGGAMLGFDAPRRRAAAAFRRALELDASFVEARTHLFQIAAAEGDTAAVRRLGSMALAAGSASDFADYLRWQMASSLGDGAALTALRTRFDWMNEVSLQNITRRSQEIGIGLEDARRAVAALVKQADTKAAQAAALDARYVLALNGGRPREALAAIAESERLGVAFGYNRAMDGLYWDGDSAAAVSSVREGAAEGDAALESGVERRDQYDVICRLQQWRLAHDETRTARVAIERLRAAVVPGLSAHDSAVVTAYASVCARVLEAWLATATRQPGAAVLAARLDSLSRRNPPGWTGTFNLVVARLLEAQGNPAGALEAVRRRSYGFVPRYLSSYLREEGRLAALVGDTAGAVRADRHYLALRFDPEPPLKPQRDSVRAGLARLVRDR
jgi:DNA-binding SARP family transcriptional activator